MSAGDHLSPAEFQAQFQPSEYGSSWGAAAEVIRSEPPHEFTPSHEELVADVRARGIDVPVMTHRNYVVDGHHRVVAAMDAGREISFERSPFPLYEGQVPDEDDD